MTTTGRSQRPLAKAATGIMGLDEILEGGFPEERITVISGGPGTGKTIMALEFLYRGALDAEPGILVAFEESAENLRRNARALGWDLAEMEKAGKLFLFDAKVNHKALISGDFSIKGLLAIVEGMARKMGARRIVIDAVDVLMRTFDDQKQQEDELYALDSWLREKNFTTILTVKNRPDLPRASRYEILDYMADCVVLLDMRVVSQVATRRLLVSKYRGSSFNSNEYPYVITDSGNVVIPVSRASLTHAPLGDFVSSGNPDLDTLLGGGFRQGSSVLIAGASGTGKTTLASLFAESASRQNHKVLFMGFEESAAAIIDEMHSAGIDLDSAVKAGNLEFVTIMPESIGPETHLIKIMRLVDSLKPHHIIVDAISAIKRMGGDQAAYNYLLRLVDLCKSKGITCMMTNQLTGFDVVAEFTGLGFSSLIDTAVLLGYHEYKNEFIRRLLVFKSRGVKHAAYYRRLLITEEGIRITDLPQD